MPEFDPAVPAQPAEPPPPSAVQAAATSGDVAAFREARRAERQTPAAPPVTATAEPVSPEPTAPAPPVQTVSKRQQQINDYERRIAEQAQRIRALEAPAPPPRREATPPAADPEPDPADAAKYPEGQYDRKFLKDQARWEARAEFTARQHEARTAMETEHVTRALAHRAQAFQERVLAAKTATPDFDQRINPNIWLSTPVLDFVQDSDAGPDLLLHFSAHPDDAARLSALHPILANRELTRLETRLAGPASSGAPAALQQAAAHSPISAAPPPPPVINSAGSTADPKTRALVTGDVRSFRAVRRAEREAQRSGRRA